LYRRAGDDGPAAPDPAALSKLDRLRHYREQRSYEPLCQLLDELAQTDPLLSEDKDKKNRAGLGAELKALCEHPDTGVKVRAMSAYARWDPAGARAVCLAAVGSESYEERRRALELLTHWRDHAAARAAAALIGRPGVETNLARATLEQIGGAPAEEAAWGLLKREDQATRLTALEIIETVGGPHVEDEPVRRRAERAARAIEARLGVVSPAP
jgi:hypothetical protein